jgi:hypothetical protein
MLVLTLLLHLGQLSLSEQLLLLKGQHNVVEQRLSQVLLDVLDAYLRLNELVVQNGERILEDGHTPSGLGQHYQRYLQERKNLWLCNLL